jgi:hypothetical protein
MRWFVGPRTVFLAGLVAAFAVLPIGSTAALGSSECSRSTTPELAPRLADLQLWLGDDMGSPVSCAQQDQAGDVVQVTTTGVATARADGMATFISGEQHWAITPDGYFEAWTGNWHTGLYPPVTPASVQDQPAPSDALASVEPMLVVQMVQDGSNGVVVEDLQGSMFTVQPDTGCPDVVAAPGDHIYIRTGAARTDLIDLQQHETCAVAQMNPAAGD